MTYINQEDEGNLDYSSFSAAYVGSLLSPVPYSWAMEKAIFQQNEISETSAMCNDDGKLWTEDVWIGHVIPYEGSYSLIDTILGEFPENASIKVVWMNAGRRSWFLPPVMLITKCG
ncbi:hypothetical protein NI479_003624 [Salmonella enterica]|uniref:Uncharacterized protein n=1 Tax=Salmonella enterica subsp. enterica serovar Aqua TaxID=1302615 RepID=A0A5X6ER84_SALET|nr:hypothetical protein [Salmonella enterica subsp. enterica serovar Aqua]ECH1171714.1 hypothetical protein [Salmonella enterica subsp. enterica serovar Aqua]EIK6739803.1 hypothetical protein [Salmonella enterica subsp. enterica serovar Aqua]EJJ3921549.1 hypothetical protein [Salmonella enterica]EJJ4346463.1 hypothetical protein [Salmonella enterica]